MDAVFFRRLRRLLAVLIPGPLSSPVAYIVLVALVLVARTACDVWLIKNHTMIETWVSGQGSQGRESTIE